MNRVKQVVHAEKVYKQGYTGKNITIVLMDSGVDITHPDLKNCLVYFADYENKRLNCYDDNGHGTHVAGILCGNGKISHGLYSGMAPDAKLIVLKVLDKNGNGSTDNVLKAIDWVYQNRKKYNIRLLNFSIGYLPNAKIEEQRNLIEAIEQLWDSGIMVVSAAGNKGPKQRSITIPGISRKILTVGACDDQNENFSTLKRGYSGKGPTECCIVKPEILAPGTRIKSTGKISKTNMHGYIEKSGTSMATPVACGAMALAMEKNRELTPASLKLFLYKTCIPVTGQRCWGILHVDNLMDAIN